jgi:hypothetical protein
LGQVATHGEDLFLIVGDVDEGDADLSQNALSLDLNFLSKFE